MIGHFQEGSGLRTNIDLHGSGAVGAYNARQEARLEAKAARMHMLSRYRGQHFVTPAMADSAMDMMLSLFVGELQNCDVSEMALATANLLSRKETSTLIDKLVQAGLAVLTGHEPDGRTVGLSPLGSARMRNFVNNYPDV